MFVLCTSALKFNYHGGWGGGSEGKEAEHVVGGGETEATGTGARPLLHAADTTSHYITRYI